MPTWAPLADFQVLSDAAGSLGFRAIFKSHWFSGAWSVAKSSLSIAYKEVFPTVGSSVGISAGWVVAVLKSGTLWNKSLMVLLSYLTMLAIRHSFSLTASSVQGKANPIAECRCTLSVPISAVQTPGATCRFNTIPYSCLPSGSASDALTQKCQFLLTHGLAPYTRQEYSSAQWRFIDSCR